MAKRHKRHTKRRKDPDNKGMEKLWRVIDKRQDIEYNIHANVNKEMCSEGYH